MSITDHAPLRAIMEGRSCGLSVIGLLPIGWRGNSRRDPMMCGGTRAWETSGAFANDYARLALVREGRITRLELFEIGALDAALARFEELRAASITT